MRERGLELSAEKTCITHIEHGFDFLGQNVRKYRNGKRRVLLIKPSSKSITALLEKVRGIVKTNRQAPAGKLVLALNPIIKGWALYHRHVVSKTVFNDVDHAIFELLWQWARRRHRNKSAGWVKKKYYRASGGYSWVFHGEANGEDQCLTRAVKVAIVRHVKVKGEANPYDPAWEVYFEKRLGVKMADTLQGRRQLLHLWQEQGGICPICNQKITELTGWHNHHVTWRSLGGSDTAENRVLLHPNCHRQVHNLNLSVSKPRPDGAFARLEPYEGKLSRTVLRGADSGNTVRLPDPPVPAICAPASQLAAQLDQLGQVTYCTRRHDGNHFVRYFTCASINLAGFVQSRSLPGLCTAQRERLGLAASRLLLSWARGTMRPCPIGLGIVFTMRSQARRCRNVPAPRLLSARRRLTDNTLAHWNSPHPDRSVRREKEAIP